MQILILLTFLFSGSFDLDVVEPLRIDDEIQSLSLNNVLPQIDPDSNLYELYETRGAKKFEEGNYKEAIQDFKKALEIEPESSYSAQFLGIAYYRLKEYKNSIVVFDKMIDRDSTDYISFTNRAEIYRDMGELKKASADIKQALSMEKEDGYIYATIAMIHAEQGQIELFYKNIEKAIDVIIEYPLNEKIKEKRTLQLFKNDKRFQKILKKSFR